MRQLPEPLQRRLKEGGTTFCTCWRITRRDGQVLGLTDHDRVIGFDNTVFHPDAAIDLSAIDTRLGLDIPRPEIEGALSSAHLTAIDLKAGLYDHADFEIWLVDWQENDSRVLLLAGRFGQLRRSGSRFHVGLTHHGAELGQTRGRVYQKTCDAALGDKRCRAEIQRTPFTLPARIVSATGAQMLIAPDDGFDVPEGWFAHGYVKTDDDRNLLIRDDRLAEPHHLLYLWQEAELVDAVSSRVTLVAGCDKRLSTCRRKFDNAVNYQGFPDLADDTVLINIGPGA